MLFWFELISADPSKVLVCAVNSRRLRYSVLWKLFGDPEQYVYKLANDTFADQLPIEINRFGVRRYGYFSYISLDQSQHRVWYADNAARRLKHGNLIYHNATIYGFYYAFLPETYQVLKHYSHAVFKKA